MMRIELKKVSKRYSERWILKNCSLSLQSGNIYALIGPNGSGKSTLIKLMSGFLSATKGQIDYSINEKPVDRDEIFRHISLAAPYALMFRKLTLGEMVRLIQKFKPLYDNLNLEGFLEILEIDATPETYLRDLSSGQFQKFGLAVAMLTESDILLLDEPGSFLDEGAKAWFHLILARFKKDRLVVIASNDESDLKHATHRIGIADFK